MRITRPRTLQCLIILSLILALVRCFGGSETSELVLLPPGPTAVRLGESLQLSSTDPVTIWTVVGGEANGSIDPFGLYQAPDVMPPDPTVVIRGEFNGGDAYALIELQP